MDLLLTDVAGGGNPFGGGGGPFGGGGGGGRPANDLYDNSEVEQLGDNSFQHKLEQREWVYLVEFYAPWCGHCQEMKEDYKQLANKFKNIVPVAAVNCERNKQTCNQQPGVEGYPTLMLYGADKSEAPVIYAGSERSAAALGAWLSKHLPTNTTLLTNEKKYLDWLNTEPDLAKVVLFTDKKTVPPIIKRLSHEFRGRLSLAVAMSSNPKFVEKFKPPRFPSILYVQDLDKPYQVDFHSFFVSFCTA